MHCLREPVSDGFPFRREQWIKQVILDFRMNSLLVEAVARALSTFGREVRNTISEADELDDADTADLFTEISRGIDKWLWFVEAHSQAPK